MNAKSWIAILAATTTVSLVSTNIFNQPSHAEATYSKDKINFYCGEVSEKESGQNIPATIAYVPQRKANVAIIAWKSNYIPEWDAQKRCNTVSPKFQTFFEDGRLEYLTTGENQGYDIICAAVEKQKCKPEDQLFQVKASNNPETVLKGLTGIIEGTSSEPIYQNSGQQIYVSIEKLLNNAPAIKEANLTSK
ncbi:MAG: COP23 domain-containing protein [Xenococcaceae cyanobacterium]